MDVKQTVIYKRLCPSVLQVILAAETGCEAYNHEFKKDYLAKKRRSSEYASYMISTVLSLEPGELVGESAGHVIEGLRVRILTGAVGESSSPKLALCTDTYSVSVPPPCYRSGT